MESKANNGIEDSISVGLNDVEVVAIDGDESIAKST